MAVNPNVRAHGGAWDITLAKASEVMGFMTPAPASVEQISNAATRIRVGGDPAYSNEAFEQLIIPDFAVGGDRLRYEASDRRYQYSDGKVALHVPGRVTLASRWNELDTSNTATAKQILDFSPSTGAYDPRICFGVGTKIRAYNTSTTAMQDCTPGGVAFAGNVKHLYCNDQYMFVALGTSGSYRWTGQSNTAGFTSLGVNADCFGWYQEVLYRGLGSTLYVATANDGSAWSGTTYEVGSPGRSIVDMYEASNLLIITKPEGLYAWDGANVIRLVDFTESRSTLNGAYGAEWHGAIYFQWLNTVQKGALVNNLLSSMQDVTPRQQGSLDKQRYGHGNSIVRMFATPHKLVCAFNDGEGVYPEVLAYNELGWHQLYRGTSGEDIAAAGFSRLMDWIVINVNGKTLYKRVTNGGEGEYPDWGKVGTVVTGEFYTPILDGGYPDELKIWHSIRFGVEDLGPSLINEYLRVEVYYRTDGTTSWTTAGLITRVPDTPDSLVEVVLDPQNRQVSGKSIEFKFLLHNSGGAAYVARTPIMKGPWVVRYIPYPRQFDRFNERVILDLSQTLRNGAGTVGSNAGYTITQMLNFLEGLRNTGTTVIRTDEFGRRNYVKLVHKSEIAIRKDDTTTLREYREVSLSWVNADQGVTRVDLSVDDVPLRNAGLTTAGLTEQQGAWASPAYYVRLGTGSQSFAVGLTALVAEISNALSSATKSTVGTRSIFKAVFDNSMFSSSAITEWGLFAGLTLVAYGTFDIAQVKTYADQLAIEITVKADT